MGKADSKRTKKMGRRIGQVKKKARYKKQAELKRKARKSKQKG